MGFIFAFIKKICLLLSFVFLTACVLSTKINDVRVLDYFHHYVISISRIDKMTQPVKSHISDLAILIRDKMGSIGKGDL